MDTKDPNMSTYYSGTSGIALPVSNKQGYPEAFRNTSRLVYYASLFNSLEINSTFTKLPMARTVERWTSEVNEQFQFTFKLSKAITHAKGLLFQQEEVRRFCDLVNRASNNKGCILIQFPGKLAIDHTPQLEKLLQAISAEDKENEWRKAVEFRHSSWYVEETYKLLDRYKAALVYHDLPNAPSMERITGGFVYMRFHGTEKGYRGSYTDEALKNYARQIKAWTADGKTVYTYFNNTLGDAANNLITLNRMLQGYMMGSS